MIRACSHVVVSNEAVTSAESPTSRPAESGTFPAEVGRSPAKNSQTAKQKASRKAAAKLLRKIAAAKRRERELMQKLAKERRPMREEMPSNPGENASRPTESGTFSAGVGQAIPPAPEAPADNPAQASAEIPEPTLHDRQTLALGALLHGESNTAAAKAAGVDRRTVFRWRQQPAFQAELHRIQSGVCASLRATSADLVHESLQVIHEAIRCGNVNASLDLLKAVNILNGQPLAEIDGLDADAKPDPAVVFPAPVQPADASPAEQAESTPGETSDSAPVETVKSQTSAEPLDLGDLIPTAQLAIQALISGKDVIDAAKQADVPLSMLRHWMRSDESFRQVLRTCRQEQTLELQTQLLTMGDRALDVLRFALKKRRDVRVAFAILRGLGLVKHVGS